MNSSKVILLVLFVAAIGALYAAAGFAAGAFHLHAPSLLIGFYACGFIVAFGRTLYVALVHSYLPVWAFVLSFAWPLMVLHWILINPVYE
jgi:hypothetical protein